MCENFDLVIIVTKRLYFFFFIFSNIFCNLCFGYLVHNTKNTT